MSDTARIDASLRERLISQPDIVLDDTDLMRALVAANERAMGENIIDLRGVAMARLETRLDRLEETHRSVIAAAYDNVAGTNQVHRAVLSLLECEDLEGVVATLGTDVAEILRVDSARLLLEAEAGHADEAEEGAGLSLVAPGEVDAYIAGGRKRAPRPVTLRQIACGEGRIHGQEAAAIRSEACLRLDLGEGRLPGLVVLASSDAEQFTPQHGTDLLAFLAGATERTLRRWLP